MTRTQTLSDISETLRLEKHSKLATRARWLRDSPDPVVRSAAADLETYLYRAESELSALTDQLAAALYIHNSTTEGDQIQ